MKSYIELLQKIMSEGRWKKPARNNMPRTIGISNAVIKHDLSNGFPLLTTKKMYWKGIVHELLWFLRGDTNIKYLVDNNVNIWNQDAYRWYLVWWNESGSKLGFPKIESLEAFILEVKKPLPISQPFRFEHYRLGDLGRVYGHQWRNQNGVDQVKEVLESLKTNPDSRYHIIDGWNKADFKDMALPPCHLLYQFICRPLTGKERKAILDKIENLTVVKPIDKESGYMHEMCDNYGIPRYYLDLNMYQRSCDTFLGVPFNIASISLLNVIFAKTVGMVPGEITWIGGDTHLYENHIDHAKLQCERTPETLPTMLIYKELKSIEDIENLSIDDFELIDYEPYPAIKAEISTGL